MNYAQPPSERFNSIIEHGERGKLFFTRAEIREALVRFGATKIKVNRWRGGCRYTVHYLDRADGQIRFVICEPHTYGGIAPKRRRRN